MSYADVANMLINETVETIAKGQEYDRFEQGGATKLKILHNGHLLTLVKSKGSNARMLTAFEIFDDETGKGYGKTSPTHNQPYSARADVGASNNQTMDNGGVATSQSLRTNSPIRTRTDVGALDGNIISQDNTLNNFDIKFIRMADFYEQSTDTTKKKAVERLSKVASEFVKIILR